MSGKLERECRGIYREAFCDPNDIFENKLFGCCFKYCRVLKENGSAAAMLFALPCSIYGDGGVFSAVYIYAAATKAEYRGRGLMSSLIESLKAEGKPLFLVPANAGLVSFYQKLGFVPFNASAGEESGIRAVPQGGFADLAQSEEKSRKPLFRAMFFSNNVGAPENMYFPYLME